MWISKKGLRSHHAGGSVAVVWSVTLMLIAMVIGLAVDGASVVNSKMHMQAALDAASLKGAKTLADSSVSESDAMAVMSATFSQNMKTARSDLTCGTVVYEIQRDQKLVGMSAECSFPTMLGGAFWPEQAYVQDSSTSMIPLVNLDVVMVVDASGSMAGSRMTALKSAVKSAANLMFGASDNGSVRIALVAYGSGVNAGKYGKYVLGREDNLDYIEDLDPLVFQYRCVAERIDGGATDDTAPGEGNYFSSAPWYCPINAPLPLTADAASFDAEVDTLDPRGSTAGHLGVAWGWYLLSPNWSHVWPQSAAPLDYNQPGTAKVMILMTDGAFNLHFDGGTDTSADQAEDLCTAIRNVGIEIYSVAFDAEQAGKDTLLACAGDASRSYEAANASELTKAYTDIAGMVTQLRLVE